MRIFVYAVLLALAFFAVMAIIGQCSAYAAETRKIYDDRGRQIGTVYDPGHGRRLQIRDNDRRIKGYIERDGTVTDSRRRRIKKIELDD